MRVLSPAEIEKAFDLARSDAERGRHFRSRVRRAAGRGGRRAGSGRPHERCARLSLGGLTAATAAGLELKAMKARVFVTLKPSVFDPQGQTIADALHSMGYAGVGDVRQGKYFELEVAASSSRSGAHARRRSRRQAAGESGDRELQGGDRVAAQSPVHQRSELELANWRLETG